jgi:hypothetical protein
MLTSKDIAQRKVEIEQLANKYGIVAPNTCAEGEEEGN